MAYGYPYTLCQKFLLFPTLTLALSSQRGERG
jgi:hypothetical protein